MSDTPHQGPPPITKRHYSRPDPDMTAAEIDAWAARFVDAVLGDVDQAGEPVNHSNTPKSVTPTPVRPVEGR